MSVEVVLADFSAANSLDPAAGWTSPFEGTGHQLLSDFVVSAGVISDINVGAIPTFLDNLAADWAAPILDNLWIECAIAALPGISGYIILGVNANSNTVQGYVKIFNDGSFSIFYPSLDRYDGALGFFAEGDTVRLQCGPTAAGGPTTVQVSKNGVPIVDTNGNDTAFVGVTNNAEIQFAVAYTETISMSALRIGTWADEPGEEPQIFVTT